MAACLSQRVMDLFLLFAFVPPGVPPPGARKAQSISGRTGVLRGGRDRSHPSAAVLRRATGFQPSSPQKGQGNGRVPNQPNPGDSATAPSASSSAQSPPAGQNAEGARRAAKKKSERGPKKKKNAGSRSSPATKVQQKDQDLSAMLQEDFGVRVPHRQDGVESDQVQERSMFGQRLARSQQMQQVQQAQPGRNIENAGEEKGEEWLPVPAPSSSSTSSASPPPSASPGMLTPGGTGAPSMRAGDADEQQFERDLGLAGQYSNRSSLPMSTQVPPYNLPDPVVGSVPAPAGSAASPMPEVVDVNVVPVGSNYAMESKTFDDMLDELAIRAEATSGRLFRTSDPLVSQALEEVWHDRVMHQRDIKDGIPQYDVTGSPFLDSYTMACSGSLFLAQSRLYRGVGVIITHNFGDFTVPLPSLDELGDGEEFESPQSTSVRHSLEQWSRWKAHAVYLVTGLPCIAESTDFCVPAQPQMRNDRGFYARVWNSDIVEKAVQRFGPVSPPERRARFESVAVYYDGETEVVGKGVVECELEFMNPSRAIIAMASALDNVYKVLYKRFSFDLAYFDTISRDNEMRDLQQTTMTGATFLRQRIMNEAKVLRDGILKVSSFLNHKVDTRLMDLCGQELAARLQSTRPNKVLTVEATGLIPGLTVARVLNVPLVFARKSRPISISDSYQTTYRSATKGTTSELVVSEEYLGPSDRVIIIDDFLAGGSTVEALFKLARMASARVVGVGVLIEKVSDSGRTALSGYDVPIISLAKVSKIEEGHVEVLDEPPFNRIERVDE
ncbi:Xanthine phosphoribosyltransferase [Porphyridium purpureum]|uniref:Xanthine phosphoribosyltransferase n=1 Tax=Porphyridium purpureum TaxID=35688 RepID=A0A5J4YYX8_PORPP|nr:Xanthine phosphoribosyltransferase [Porphyridium purpureum]|eukprot:POR1894..scf209_3